MKPRPGTGDVKRQRKRAAAKVEPKTTGRTLGDHALAGVLVVRKPYWAPGNTLTLEAATLGGIIGDTSRDWVPA